MPVLPSNIIHSTDTHLIKTKKKKQKNQIKYTFKVKDKIKRQKIKNKKKITQKGITWPLILLVALE